MIEIEHLNKTYPSPTGDIHALRDVDLRIEDGEIFGIIGLSGAGKSTLVRCINLLERPTSGTVRIDGRDMTQLSRRDLLKARQDIGMIFQSFNLLEQRTVLRNICFPLEIAGVKRDKRTITINILKFLFGTAFIVAGAQLLVTYGSELAVRMNVPESIIAVTMVAIGTSLPELVTTITAIAKKQASLSVGNIIGANIIDLTLILPVCSFISGRSGLDINAQTVFLDMPVCLGFVLISVVPSMITGKFARWQGITLLALYIGYIVVLSTGVLGF